MQRIPYTPSRTVSNPAASAFIPTYLYTGLPDPQGLPDISIRDDFYNTRRKLRIGVLGAGISALQFLHFATERLKDVEIVVYEMEEDVGGVVSHEEDDVKLC
jgi:hypothetical protein